MKRKGKGRTKRRLREGRSGGYDRDVVVLYRRTITPLVGAFDHPRTSLATKGGRRTRVVPTCLARGSVPEVRPSVGVPRRAPRPEPLSLCGARLLRLCSRLRYASRRRLHGRGFEPFRARRSAGIHPPERRPCAPLVERPAGAASHEIERGRARLPRERLGLEIHPRGGRRGDVSRDTTDASREVGVVRGKRERRLGSARERGALGGGREGGCGGRRERFARGWSRAVGVGEADGLRRGRRARGRRGVHVAPRERAARLTPAPEPRGARCESTRARGSARAPRD